jgi:hypothetical protein
MIQVTELRFGCLFSRKKIGRNVAGDGSKRRQKRTKIILSR